MSTKEELSIKDVCEEYNLSQVYVRRSILKGKLKSHTITIAKNTTKHMMFREDVEAWRSLVGEGGSRRDDGRNKYNVYCTQEEYEKLQSLLEETHLELPIQRSNPPKSTK